MEFNRLNIAGNYRQLNFQTIWKATGNQSRSEVPTEILRYPRASQRIYYNNIALEGQNLHTP